MWSVDFSAGVHHHTREHRYIFTYGARQLSDSVSSRPCLGGVGGGTSRGLGVQPSASRPCPLVSPEGAPPLPGPPCPWRSSYLHLAGRLLLPHGLLSSLGPFLLGQSGSSLGWQETQAVGSSCSTEFSLGPSVHSGPSLGPNPCLRRPVRCVAQELLGSCRKVHAGRSSGVLLA